MAEVIENILKILLIFLICIILITIIILTVKNNIVINIIDKSYSKIEYMKELNNYKLKIRTIESDLKTNNTREYVQTYYYKDGKYKVESDNGISFFEDNSYKKICVYNDLKQIDYYNQNYVEFTKGKILNTFSEIINYKKISNTFYNLALSVRCERYNGVECYVIRFGNNTSYRDTWIDKNSFITVKVVNEDVGIFYREDSYLFYEDATTDEDVDKNILDSEKYNSYVKNYINNNLTEENPLYKLYTIY